MQVTKFHTDTNYCVCIFDLALYEQSTADYWTCAS